MSINRRENSRTRFLRRARIVLRNGFTTIDCIVLDRSSGGARLKVPPLLALPNEFELRIENGPAQRVEVRFRKLEVVGVRFLDVAA